MLAYCGLRIKIGFRSELGSGVGGGSGSVSGRFSWLLLT